MRARIHWKTAEQGGRAPLQTGIVVGSHRYAPIVRFTDVSHLPPPPITWTLVVEKLPELSEEYEWVANVYYRAPGAPTEELTPGREFELYEGKKRVATGVLIGETGETNVQ